MATIEHVFEGRQPVPPGGVSLLEARLSGWLYRARGLPELVVDFEPHVSRPAPDEHCLEPVTA
ncbi:MAG: hypothetical protein JWQ99_4049, partial [Blastococcus sp.]|nr:hypothetical protein [Blastococcus sp.]